MEINHNIMIMVSGRIMEINYIIEIDMREDLMEIITLITMVMMIKRTTINRMIIRNMIISSSIIRTTMTSNTSETLKIKWEKEKIENICSIRVMVMSNSVQINIQKIITIVK
jgi:hypothetical protein